MRTLIQNSLLLYLFLTLSSITNATTGIQVSISPSECKPGDMVTIQAQMNRAELAEFDLKIPKIEALYPVYQNTSAAIYVDGSYQQTKTWTFQPARSGVFKLDGLILTINGSDTLQPAFELNVSPYATKEDSLTLEQIPPTDETEGERKLPKWLIQLVILSLFLVSIPYIQKKFKKQGDKPSSAVSKLELLKEASANGKLSSEMIEDVLIDPELTLPKELRALMEQTIYRADKDFSQVEESLLK